MKQATSADANHVVVICRLIVAELGVTREMVAGVSGCSNDAYGAVGNYEDSALAEIAADALTTLLDAAEGR
jgi:hypothetical protein